MVTLHLEVNQTHLIVSGVKVTVTATHADEPTFKFYMDPTLNIQGVDYKSELPNFLLTSKSTKLEDFFQKCHLSKKKAPR
jgi:hypothetical protein